MKKFVKLTAALNDVQIHVDPAHVECVMGKGKDSGKHVGCAIRFASGEIVGVHEDIETVVIRLGRAAEVALKVVLDDIREWADRLDPPPRSYEGANFLTRLDAYEKEREKDCE